MDTKGTRKGVGYPVFICVWYLSDKTHTICSKDQHENTGICREARVGSIQGIKKISRYGRIVKKGREGRKEGKKE